MLDETRLATPRRSLEEEGKLLSIGVLEKLALVRNRPIPGR
jgi:hypothetical protein